MKGKTDSIRKKINKKVIISIGMILCFIVSYLPVTNFSYMSLNDRSDLSMLIMSAVSIKNYLEKKSSQNDLSRNRDLIRTTALTVSKPSVRSKTLVGSKALVSSKELAEAKKLARSKELARSINNVFKELKIATGQVKVHENHRKSAVSLTKIIPEFPMLRIRSFLNAYQDFFVLISHKKIFYQTYKISPDTPPPRRLFVS